MTNALAFLAGVGLCTGLALLAGVALALRAGRYDVDGRFQP